MSDSQPIIPLNLPPNLTVRQVTDILRVSIRTGYDLIARGDIGHYRVGGAIRVPREALKAYLEAAWRQPKAQDCDEIDSTSGASSGTKTANRDPYQLGRKMKQRQIASSRAGSQEPKRPSSPARP